MLKWAGAVLLVLIAVIAVVATIGATLPVKHVASRSAIFDPAPQQVWQVITSPPTWRPDVQRYEVLKSDPAHRKWREYSAHGQKITYEVVAFEPPRKMITRIADAGLPFGGTWTYIIEPAPNGSVLTITENGEIYNPIFRFVARYMIGYNGTIDAYLKALHASLDRS